MLAKTVAELTQELQELLTVATEALKSVESEFETLFIEAQKLGEVTSSKSAEELARYLQVQITGMRVYAKTCENDEPLVTMIDELFENFSAQLN
jgi:hypothetical protein